MKDKKLKREKTVYKKDGKVRVKNSYYTFSKQYPKGYLKLQKKRKLSSRSVLHGLCLAVCFVLVMCLSFFVVDLAVEISQSPADVGANDNSSSFMSNEKIKENGLRALYMPYTKLGDEQYIKDIIKKTIRKDGNSVVIDFKTAEGKLCYSSLHDYAIAGGCSIFDNDTVRKAIRLFSDADIAVVARISCFKDAAVAETSPECAVKYMNTDVNWLDGSDENGGKAWLNPYSKSACDYLISVIQELRAFRINCFILDYVQFPSGENTQGATYPDEKTEALRNTVLKDFIKRAVSSGDENSLFFMGITALDALDGNDTIYFGDILNSEVFGAVIDTSKRPESYVVDKKTDFISILSLYSSVNSKLEGKTFVPLINESEYSASYFRALRKNSYQSFLLYSENGVY